VHGDSDGNLGGSFGWNRKGDQSEQKQSGKLSEWHVEILAAFDSMALAGCGAAKLVLLNAAWG